jgi:hypothetical protein
MKWKVKLMRKSGRRIPWKFLVNDPGSTGQIRTHFRTYPNKAPYKVAVLLGEPALPELFAPQLLEIAHDVVLLRGFEQVKGANGSYTVLQEWRCEPL